MHASVHLLSASRQNLRLLTLIRVLVLAAQAGAVGLAYATPAVSVCRGFI
jgi:two-component system, sensor histidine kinase RegB